MSIDSGNLAEPESQEEVAQDTLFEDVEEESIEDILGVEPQEEEVIETTTEEGVEEEAEAEVEPEVEAAEVPVKEPMSKEEQSFKDRYYSLLEKKEEQPPPPTPQAESADAIADSMHSDGYVDNIRKMVEEADITEAFGNSLLKQEYSHRKEIAEMKQNFGNVQSEVASSKGATKVQTLSGHFAEFGIEKGSAEEKEALNLLKDDFNVDFDNPSVLAEIGDEQIAKLAKYVGGAVKMNQARRNPGKPIVKAAKVSTQSRPVVQKQIREDGKAKTVSEIIQAAREGKSI